MRGRAILGLAGAALAVVAAQPTGRIYGAANIKRYLQQRGRSQRSGSFDPVLNRHTGAPHEHAREKARRERQAARNQERQAVRLDADLYGKARRNCGVVGMTRRGRLVKP